MVLILVDCVDKIVVLLLSIKSGNIKYLKISGRKVKYVPEIVLSTSQSDLFIFI